ncbi:MAG: alpha/beta fold hydrolase, partial [Xanthomonas perforans]|nr:alpha/beta fold hydrolase [Xanthomonas perforans]
RPHLYLMQPYDPNRRVLLMLHGLASSPEAWVNVANEVMGDEALRQRYQIWQVYYPTNAPVAVNRAEIQALVERSLQHFDPSGTAIASHDMVLIGHSMGGVIGRLLVS